MPVDRLGHINIRTAIVAETIAFYEEVIGLTRGDAATMVDQANNAWLYSNDGLPIIHVNARRGDEPDPQSTNPVLDHVALDCSDIDAMTASLDAAHVDYSLRQTRVPGLVQINLRDPNGIRLELTFGHENVRIAS